MAMSEYIQSSAKTKITLTANRLQGFGCRLPDLIDQFLACLLCSLRLTDGKEIFINKDPSVRPIDHHVACGSAKAWPAAGTI